MEYNEDRLFHSRAHSSDREGFKHHLDSIMHYPMQYKGQWQAERDEDERIPNDNMAELQAELQAEREEYLQAKRLAGMGFALGDLPGSEFEPELESEYESSESESESESDFNKCAVQEEAFMEAKKDPSQPDSHDSTEEEQKKKKDAC